MPRSAWLAAGAAGAALVLPVVGIGRTPAIIVSRKRAAGRWSDGTRATADPAANAAALVVVITISRVLAVRPPAVGPAKLA